MAITATCTVAFLQQGKKSLFTSQSVAAVARYLRLTVRWAVRRGSTLSTAALGFGWGRTLIVVVGLAFEARIAAGPGVRVICSGDGRTLAGRLEDAISDARVVAGGCPGIVSFGVAGGLAPTLQPGTCIIATAILSSLRSAHGNRRGVVSAVHADNSRRDRRHASGCTCPGCSPGHEKRALHEQTGAIAVDMGSHIVAAVGARNGVPVAAVRVITDPAMRALPPSAVAAMRIRTAPPILAP